MGPYRPLPTAKVEPPFPRPPRAKIRWRVVGARLFFFLVWALANVLVVGSPFWWEVGFAVYILLIPLNGFPFAGAAPYLFALACQPAIDRSDVIEEARQRLRARDIEIAEQTREACWDAVALSGYGAADEMAAVIRSMGPDNLEIPSMQDVRAFTALMKADEKPAEIEVEIPEVPEQFERWKKG